MWLNDSKRGSIGLRRINMTSDSDFTFVYWCSGCNAEQAVDEIEVHINGEWCTINIGQNCLTRLKDDGRIEM